MALGDQQRRPAILILSIPNLDLGSLVGEELHDPRQILVGRPVHGGFAVGIHRIHIHAEIQGQLRGFEHFRLRSGRFIGGGPADPDAARGHQRRAVINIPQQGIGAQFDQHAHEGGVRGSSRHQEWRRADLVV